MAKREDEDKEKGKKRRIHGDDYWTLHKADVALEDEIKAFSEWSRKKAQDLGIYPDQAENLRNGRLRSDKDSTTGTCPNCGTQQTVMGPVMRLIELESVPDEAAAKAIMAAADVEWEKIEKKRKARNALLDSMAVKYHTWPDLLDARTGEIKDSDVEAADTPEEDKKPPENEQPKKDKKKE